MAAIGVPQPLRLLDLRPNNWFINQAKLDRVRDAWEHGEQTPLPPVLVSEIDGELALIPSRRTAEGRTDHRPPGSAHP